MKVILFGATGMVGQGVLQECLCSGEVAGVLSIGRRAMIHVARDGAPKRVLENRDINEICG
jgi:hypothetical protein